MTKISALSLVSEPDGSETTVVVKDGVTRRAAFGSLVTAAAGPHVMAAELARDQAVDLVLPQNVFIEADLPAARMAGEVATGEGTYFKAVGQAEGLSEIRKRTSDGSTLLYEEFTRPAVQAALDAKVPSAAAGLDLAEATGADLGGAPLATLRDRPGVWIKTTDTLDAALQTGSWFEDSGGVKYALDGTIADIRSFGINPNGSAHAEANAAAWAKMAAWAKGTAQATPARTVIVPPGDYYFDGPLDYPDFNLISDNPNGSVNFTSVGCAEQTFLTKPPATWGGASFGVLAGIRFQAGSKADEPECFVDLGANLVDVLYQIRNCHFGRRRIGSNAEQSCTGDAIRLAAWLNLHWRDLRFDSPGGFAIRAGVGSSSHNLGSFLLDGFTYDQYSLAANGEGVVCIDNTPGAGNLGAITIAHGRIEVNSPWGGNRSIVEFITPGADTRSAGIVLDDVTYADASGMANDCVLYRNSANSTSRQSLILRNWRSATMSAVLGGTWPSNQYLFPNPANIAELIVNIDANGSAQLGAEYLQRAVAATDYHQSSFASTEAEARFRRRADGRMEWGAGNSATDTNLYRRAANELKTDAKFIATAGLGVGNSAAATTPGTVIRKMEVFDANGASLGFVPIYDGIA